MLKIPREDGVQKPAAAKHAAKNQGQKQVRKQLERTGAEVTAAMVAVLALLAAGSGFVAASRRKK